MTARLQPIHVGLLALFLAIMAGPHASQSALSTDDLFSLVAAEGTPAEMIANLARYEAGYFDHPPLYFLILHVFLSLGNTPFLLRLPSLLAALAASCLLVSMIVRRGFPMRPALLAGCALLGSPLILGQATFVRMYTLVLLLAAVLAILLMKLLQQPGPSGNRNPLFWGSALGVVLALMFYTSYFTLLLGPGLLLLAGWYFVFYPDRVAGKWAGKILAMALVAAGILYLPWVPVVIRLLGAEASRDVWVIPLTPAMRVTFLFDFFLHSGGVVLGTAVLATGWWQIVRHPGERIPWVLLLLFLVVVPAVLLTILTPTTRQLTARYLIFTYPILWAGGLVGLARLFSTIPAIAPRMERLLIVVMFFFAATCVFQSWMTELKRVPDWWEAAAILERHAKPEEVILTGGFLSGEAIVYHLDDPDQFRFIHYVTDLDPFYVAARDPRVSWFVNAAPLPKPYEDIIQRYFPYSVKLAGNRSLGPAIGVHAKKNFELSWGDEAVYTEPIPLSYEPPDPPAQAP